MKKIINCRSTYTLAALVLLLATAFSLTNATTRQAAAVSETSQTTVSVTVEGVSLDNLKVNGSSGTVETFNSTNTVSFDAVGVGLIELVDQDGNVLFTYDKTSPDSEHFSFDVQLPSGIGTYVLTASITGSGNTISQSITVIYKEVPIIPPIPGGGTEDNGSGTVGPGAPGTGWMIYVNGYAVPVLGLVVWAALLATIIGLIIFVAKTRKRRRNSAESETTGTV